MWIKSLTRPPSSPESAIIFGSSVGLICCRYWRALSAKSHAILLYTHAVVQAND